MARKRLNKNVIGVLSLVVFLGMIATSVIVINQLRNRDPKHFIALAEQCEREGDFAAARGFYGRAFERSRDASHWVRVGDMFHKQGDVRRALGTWREALVHQPDLVEAHERCINTSLEFARLYARTGDWQDVQDAAGALLKLEGAKSEAQSALAHHANGLALVYLVSQDPGNTARGMDELRKAVALAPESVQYPIDLAVQYIRNGQESDGEQLFADLLKRFTAPGADSSKVNLTYAQFQASRRKDDVAERHFLDSIRLAADDTEAALDAKSSYAAFLTQRWGRLVREGSPTDATKPIFDKTERLLKEAIEGSPNAYEPYQRLALLYQAADRSEDALSVCKKRLSLPMVRVGAKAATNILSTFNLMIRASEACVSLAAQAYKKDGAAARDKWLADAQQFVDDARGEHPAHPRANTQAARVRLAQGNYRAALIELRTADDMYRTYGLTDWETKKLLAGVHLELGEPGAAKEVLDPVVELAAKMQADDSSFWTLYGQVLYQNDDLDRAQAVIERVLLADPSNAEAKQVKLAILQRTGRSRDAGKLVDSPALQALLEARDHALAGDAERAMEVLLLAAEKTPDDPQLIATTVRELLDRKRNDEARAIAQKALSAKPTEVIFKKLDVLTRPGIPETERDAAMIELIQSEPDAYKRALDLISVHTNKREFAQALPLMNEAEKHLVARDTPLSQRSSLSQHRALLIAKLRVAAELKDENAMKEARDSAAKHDVDGAGGKSMLGAYHMARNEMDLAIKALREAVVLQPTDARTMTWLGQALQGANAFDDAKNHFERAVRANPNEGLAFRGLAMIAKARAETDAYEAALAKAEKLIPADPWVQGEVLVRSEKADPKAAIERRERLLAEKPDDLSNLLRLATLYEGDGALTKADGCYERILKLRPDDKDVVAAVAKYYRRTQRPDRSLQLVTSFVQQRSTPETKADAHILAASHWLGVNDLAATEKALLDGAKIAETFDVVQSLAEFYFRPANRAADALPWFDKAAKIAQQTQSGALPNVLAARISCLLHRSVNQLEEAKKSIDEFARAYPDDARGQLFLSEWHASNGRMDDAIAALSSYIARTPNDVSILFRRAQHYIAQGRMEPAIADLEQIKRTSPLAMQLDPRVQLARLYQRAGRKDLAIRELEQLVAETESAPRAVQELVEAYLRESRLSDADRVVTAQINRGGEKPDARWFALRGQVAQALGDGVKALADYVRAAELSGFDDESIRGAMDAFGRAGRFADGVAFYEKHPPTGANTSAMRGRYAFLLAQAAQKPKAVDEFRLAMTGAIEESTDAVRELTARLIAAFPNGDEAIKLFRAAAPGGPAGRANERILVRLLASAKKYDEAASALNRLIETAADDRERARLWYEFGEMYHVSGDARKAKEGYESSLRYGPDNWVTLNNLAFLLADSLGQYDEALKHALRAVAIADNPATLNELYNALDTLGWIYVGLKQYPAAIRELSRAVRLHPDEMLCYYHLGEAYRRNQQFDQANEMLQVARRQALAAKDEPTLAKISAALDKNERRDPAP